MEKQKQNIKSIMKDIVNWIIPSVKNQVLVLDRLAEFYFSWVDNFIELMSEMTWEISFRELRSTILYLYEFWYIKRSYTWKWNEFYVKITKKWISYYEKIFEPNEKIKVKDSFLDKVKKLWEWVDALKWIATWAVAIFTIFWATFHSEISEEFSSRFSAKIFQDQKNENEFTTKEAIRFLKNKFPRELRFSCKIKNENEVICEVENKKGVQKSLHWSAENKKTIFDKKIVLKKNVNWKIILVK